MRNRILRILACVVTTTAIIWLRTALWPKVAVLPPVISVTLLGYTNGIGPRALLALTNCSESAITLNPQCLLLYGIVPEGSPRRHSVSSIEVDTLRITRLRPHEGFVQDFFVGPAPDCQWDFQCDACYSSAWLDLRRFAENLFQKYVRRAKFPPRSRTWHTYNSELFTCPN